MEGLARVVQSHKQPFLLYILDTCKSCLKNFQESKRLKKVWATTGVVLNIFFSNVCPTVLVSGGKKIVLTGDQDLFKYVLEYHRDRKIILPPVVSKDAVLRELKRFGLDAEPEETLGLEMETENRLQYNMLV